VPPAAPTDRGVDKFCESPAIRLAGCESCAKSRYTRPCRSSRRNDGREAVCQAHHRHLQNRFAAVVPPAAPTDCGVDKFCESPAIRLAGCESCAKSRYTRPCRSSRRNDGREAVCQAHHRHLQNRFAAVVPPAAPTDRGIDKFCESPAIRLAGCESCAKSRYTRPCRSSRRNDGREAVCQAHHRHLQNRFAAVVPPAAPTDRGVDKFCESPAIRLAGCESCAESRHTPDLVGAAGGTTAARRCVRHTTDTCKTASRPSFLRRLLRTAVSAWCVNRQQADSRGVCVVRKIPPHRGSFRSSRKNDGREALCQAHHRHLQDRFAAVVPPAAPTDCGVCMVCETPASRFSRGASRAKNPATPRIL